MTQSMMAFAVAKPGKHGGAYRMRPLNGPNPRHIARKRTDEKLHLQITHGWIILILIGAGGPCVGWIGTTPC